MEFKVGDKVRCVRQAACSSHRLDMRRDYIVTAIAATGSLELDGGGHLTDGRSCLHDDARFTLAPAVADFQIPDPADYVSHDLARRREAIQSDLPVLDDHDAVNERAAIERELRAAMERLIFLQKRAEAMLSGEDAADFDDPEPHPVASAVSAIHDSRRRSPIAWPEFPK